MGDGPDGAGRLTHVQGVEPMKLGNMRVWHIWGWDKMPSLPCDATGAYVATSWRPPASGMRISATRFTTEQYARTEAERAIEAALNRLIDAEPCGYVDDP